MADTVDLTQDEPAQPAGQAVTFELVGRWLLALGSVEGERERHLLFQGAGLLLQQSRLLAQLEVRLAAAESALRWDLQCIVTVRNNAVQGGENPVSVAADHNECQVAGQLGCRPRCRACVWGSDWNIDLFVFRS